MKFQIKVLGEKLNFSSKKNFTKKIKELEKKKIDYNIICSNNTCKENMAIHIYDSDYCKKCYLKKINNIKGNESIKRYKN